MTTFTIIDAEGKLVAEAEGIRAAEAAVRQLLVEGEGPQLAIMDEREMRIESAGLVPGTRDVVAWRTWGDLRRGYLAEPDVIR